MATITSSSGIFPSSIQKVFSCSDIGLDSCTYLSTGVMAGKNYKIYQKQTILSNVEKFTL